MRTETAILYDQTDQVQTNRLHELLKSAKGVPVLLRTCDTSADDEAPWAGSAGPPANHRLLWPQIRALLQAAPCGDLRIVFPDDHGGRGLGRCLEEVTACRDELLAEGRETAPMMLGCVVDMPSAAVMAGDMMEHGAQLMAVDIEDLTRYTLGLVRTPPPP